ncbi:hypothetical protein GGR26_002135 [Lewinella marina]|uniref:Outer membrane protein beta-barrel domain-containing protein n=1 Tax=Neolewinella marina TaxID=438751 RepID=A0A2G0CGQ4_9BACT|nr:hypothetical protein [Neolewinella marina]NJB86367.1 hypothetical protein [Neolewinella marina]PHK99165.1 hypothetical protein CGL56_06820 [Neolewinella marina]
MRINRFRIFPLAAVLFFFAVFPSSLAAQQRLDVGVHLTPQLLPIQALNRGEVEREGDLMYTSGEDGIDLGVSAGGYLEYEVASGLFLRGGLDVVRKRYRYTVHAKRADASLDQSGVNRVAYTAMEIPLAILYRFDYLPNNDRFLIGVGAVAGRWVGDPQLKSAFYRGSSNHPPFRYNPYTLNLFAGFDRYLDSRFVLGFEPYVSYSPTPTEFRLETRTKAVAQLEAGLSLRLRFDN